MLEVKKVSIKKRLRAFNNAKFKIFFGFWINYKNKEYTKWYLFEQDILTLNQLSKLLKQYKENWVKMSEWIHEMFYSKKLKKSILNSIIIFTNLYPNNIKL